MLHIIIVLGGTVFILMSHCQVVIDIYLFFIRYSAIRHHTAQRQVNIPSPDSYGVGGPRRNCSKVLSKLGVSSVNKSCTWLRDEVIRNGGAVDCSNLSKILKKGYHKRVQGGKVHHPHLYECSLSRMQIGLHF